MEKMTIGQRIASRRKLANLSQETVSEQIGVSRQSVSKWESDAGLPDIDNLIALSKIFNVSVGWLLGTEQDPDFDPSTGLSDAQLKMVEKVIDARKPKRWSISLIAIFAVCTVVLGVLLACMVVHTKQDDLALQEKIFALENQISSIIPMQDQQKLLLSSIARPYLNDDGETVTVDFYFFPKLYQENAQAYITIENTENNIHLQIECNHTGKIYHCSTELPAVNGYAYSFILANDSGFQEQKLSDAPYFEELQNLYNASRYHLDPSVQQREQWSIGEPIYTFDAPIGSPFICFETPYVGYKSVDVTLYHNDIPIYTESLRQALQDRFGAYMRGGEMFIPDIKVDLPKLSVGDTLRLEITSEDQSGNVLTNILESLVVVR